MTQEEITETIRMLWNYHSLLKNLFEDTPEGQKEQNRVIELTRKLHHLKPEKV